MVMLMDRAPLERVRKLADGRIAAVARFARSGVYTYTGAELGKPSLPTVNVYRSDEEVFSKDAMASFGHKAVTFHHPTDGVSAENWQQVSVGFTEGRIARDGGYVEIPLMLADAKAVKAYERGDARELSAGYTSDIVWGDGIAPDGTPYQAKQTNIRGNHIALVPKGRAGSECRIGDSAPHLDARQNVAMARAQNLADKRTAYMGDRAPAINLPQTQHAAAPRGAVEAPHQTQDSAAQATARDKVSAARRQRIQDMSAAYLNR